MPDLVDPAREHLPLLGGIRAVENEVSDDLAKQCLAVLCRFDDLLLEQLLDQERRLVGQGFHEARGINRATLDIDGGHASTLLRIPASSSMSAIAVRSASDRFPGSTETSKLAWVDAYSSASRASSLTLS